MADHAPLGLFLFARYLLLIRQMGGRSSTKLSRQRSRSAWIALWIGCFRARGLCLCDGESSSDSEIEEWSQFWALGAKRGQRRVLTTPCTPGCKLAEYYELHHRILRDIVHEQVAKIQQEKLL